MTRRESNKKRREAERRAGYFESGLQKLEIKGWDVGNATAERAMERYDVDSGEMAESHRLAVRSVAASLRPTAILAARCRDCSLLIAQLSFRSATRWETAEQLARYAYWTALKIGMGAAAGHRPCQHTGSLPDPSDLIPQITKALASKRGQLVLQDDEFDLPDRRNIYQIRLSPDT